MTENTFSTYQRESFRRVFRKFVSRAHANPSNFFPKTHQKTQSEFHYFHDKKVITPLLFRGFTNQINAILVKPTIEVRLINTPGTNICNKTTPFGNNARDLMLTPRRSIFNFIFPFPAEKVSNGVVLLDILVPNSVINKKVYGENK
jgi:hypothetical protein